MGRERSVVELTGRRRGRERMLRIRKKRPACFSWLSVFVRMDFIVSRKVWRFAPGAQVYPFGKDIGTRGSLVAEAEAADEVKVLVTVAVNVVVAEETVVVTSLVIVVATTLVALTVLLATICSGHNWKEEVALFQYTSIAKRRYPMLNKSLMAVILSTV